MFNYKRIIIIGCPGSGKSTFGKKLHMKTKIDLFHLDALYWKKDCTHITREELILKQKEILNKNSFIIDGNYKSTLELRIKEADAVFLFDLPTEDCIKGVKNRNSNTPDMPCRPPSNDELIDFIINFNTSVMPDIKRLLKKYASNVITFHSHKEADEYINKINTISVKIDRPLGSFHPEHREMRYPINFGYVEGVFAPDGEEQDAYVLGVDKPLTTFTGILTAIIHRINDVEDKWVVIPENYNIDIPEIEKQVYFQERYFEHYIELL